jgi:glycosyltransferase involved in cell wall biosynthesis
MVITIAPGHEKHLPPSVLREGRHALLENWANIEEFPQFPIDNEWSRRHGIAETFNIMYSGTLGLKHDLSTFIELAKHFSSNPQVRVVIISSGQAAQELIEKARALQLTNLILLPFQPYAEVPKALASASVLVAPLEASAGAFCVPSKVLSYLCAGRPTVIAIDADNAAAATIRQADAGYVVQPGDPVSFLASVDSLLNNPGKRFAMGKSARTYAQSTFAIQNVVQKFLSILHRVDPALAVPWVAASAVAS